MIDVRPIDLIELKMSLPTSLNKTFLGKKD